MTSTQIVGLGVRLFAVWLVVWVVREGTLMWHFNASADAASTSIWVALVGTLLVLFAVVMWFFPLSVAGTLIPRSARTDHVRVAPDELQNVGFSLLGLWVLTDAVPSAFYWALMFYHSTRPELQLELSARNYTSMMVTGSELILGAWLLFGARGLLGVLRWARTAGT